MQFLLAAAKEIFGEKKLLGMLVAEGAPKEKNLVEIVEDEKIKISTPDYGFKKFGNFP